VRFDYSGSKKHNHKLCQHIAGGGSPSGKGNTNFKHGGYSKRMRQLFAEVRALNRISRETLKTIPR
jgi:hypothetical protein